MTSIPPSVSTLLTRAIARVRRLRLLCGLATVGISALLGVFTAMSLDARFVIFDDRLRHAMTAAIALLAAVTFCLAVVRPLRRRLDFRAMAKALDARHPEQEERLSTLVELSEIKSGGAGFSASLFALVGKLAEDDVVRIDLAHDFPSHSARRRLGIFALLLLALLTGIAVCPNLVGRLFVRAVAPWVDMGNLFADEIVVSPGDIVALSGTVIRIEAAPSASRHSPSTYNIRLSRRRGALWTEETSEPMENGVYETTADMNEREWRYRVNAGPAVTRYYYVRVSERPKYESFLARVTYPAYTGFSPVAYSNADVAAIRAIEGSRVKFDLRVTEPGTLADFRIGGEPLFEHTMVSNRTTNWSLELVNRDGFRSSMGVHPLVSERDESPTLVIEKPTGKLPPLPPHAKVPLELTASDDVRVLSPVVWRSVDGGEASVFHEVENFGSAGGKLWRGRTELDLSTLDLADARGVRFFVVAGDNCPPEYGGPHVVTSSVISVTLAAREWGLEIADLKAQTQKANELIEESKRRMRDAEAMARQLRDELKRDGKVSEGTEKKNERAAHEASEAQKRVEELRDRFEKDDRFVSLANPLDRTLSEKLAPAREKIEHAPFRERNERADGMTAAADELRAAQEQMDDLARRLKERAERLDAYERTKDLAERQEALARSAQALLGEHPADLDRLEAWKRLEEEAMRRADELMRQKPSAELAEARRKMETAARKITELKDAERSRNSRQEPRAKDRMQDARQASFLREAAQQQAQARQAIQSAAARREDERRLAAANNRPAAEAKAREAERFEAQAFAAQQAAEDRLERAEASDAVKAMQRQASDFERNARKARHTPGKTAEALKAQDDASAALKRELEIRDGIRKGTKAEADLAAFENELARKLDEERATRSAAMQAAADKAIRAAREAISKVGPEELDRLADAALEAAGADDPQADAEAARDARILAAQQAAVKAMERNNPGLARNLQKDIAGDQFRAAESATGDEAVARAEANAAQETARAQLDDAARQWQNQEKRAKAIEAQKAALEQEQAAQMQSLCRRAKEKIAAAAKSLETSRPSRLSQASQPSQPSQAALEAAHASAESMSRSVKSQAEALGLSGSQDPSRSQDSDGGGVESEVDSLARELKRSDSPDFFKKLFTRQGWFKIRDISKDGPSSVDLKDVPREYRDLVRRYFLKLAEDFVPPK